MRISGLFFGTWIYSEIRGATVHKIGHLFQSHILIKQLPTKASAIWMALSGWNSGYMTKLLSLTGENGKLEVRMLVKLTYQKIS